LDSAQALNHPKHSEALAAASALPPPSPSAVARFDGGSTTSRRMMHYHRPIMQTSLKWKEKEENKGYAVSLLEKIKMQQKSSTYQNL
jgi:hypothetical protein